MARLTLKGSSKYFQLSSLVVTAYPVSFSFWYRPTTSNATGTVVGLGRSGNGNNYIAVGVTSGAKPFVEIAPNATAVLLSHGTSVSNGSWAHIVVTLTNSTSRAIYFNNNKASICAVIF